MPLGFGWLEPGDPPYDELPMRVNRIAYREFSRDPDLPFERYKEILGREVFGDGVDPQAVETCWNSRRSSPPSGRGASPRRW